MSIRDEYTAEELIRANGEAEARQADEMKERIAGYASDIEELKKLYEENTKLSAALQESIASSQVKLTDLMQQSDEFSHKENVRVYRNIQAATDQMLQKQTEEFRGILEPLTAPAPKKATGIQKAILFFAVMTFIVEVCDAFGIIDMLLMNMR